MMKGPAAMDRTAAPLVSERLKRRFRELGVAYIG
jgi:hypothetical protein